MPRRATRSMKLSQDFAKAALPTFRYLEMAPLVDVSIA